jgi:hypothetical protein
MLQCSERFDLNVSVGQQVFGDHFGGADHISAVTRTDIGDLQGEFISHLAQQ